MQQQDPGMAFRSTTTTTMQQDPGMDFPTTMQQQDPGMTFRSTTTTMQQNSGMAFPTTMQQQDPGMAFRSTTTMMQQDPGMAFPTTMQQQDPGMAFHSTTTTMQQDPGPGCSPVAILYPGLLQGGEGMCSYFKERPVIITYGLLALSFILVIVLFIAVHSKNSHPEHKALASRDDMVSVNITVNSLIEKMKTVEQDAKKKYTCDAGWIVFDRKCYFFSSSKSNWFKARSMCVLKNSDLAVIKNEYEQVRCQL
ncbi:unnamed protein product [Ranitomeya imitator]|uniref:C-type lectin domain-containing protein n=1 Tax=Ranitomeya imitator TaxID=111125 RepID=A0ABN9LPA3_9NEOB|nr:unnamed protein product [Ranitomeya imitator]